MSAATEVDLEAWMQGEIEVPCDLIKWGKKCGQPAEFVYHCRCDCCQFTYQGFACGRCQKLFSIIGISANHEDGSVSTLTVTWTERIKR